MMELENLTVGYRSGRHERILMEHLNLRLAQGCVTALLGGNGRGKSTLLRTIAGLQAPLDGKVTVDGMDISTCQPSQLARLLAIVTGQSVGAGSFTVEELVRLGRQPYTGFFGRLSSHDRMIVDEAMDMVGVRQLAARHVATLSDGERQRVMIAKAISQQTPVIILDEPTAFLDVANRLELLSLMRDVSHNQDKAVLMSIHDVSSVLPIADELWLVVPDGNGDGVEAKVLTGTPSEMIASGGMQRLFPDRDIRFDADRGDFIAGS